MNPTQCDAVWDLLSPYADRETSPEQSALVESHVAGCTECARDLQFMISTQAAFSTVPEVTPPAHLRAAILAATVDRAGMGRRISDTIHRLLAPAPARYGFAIAAGVAGIFVAVAINRNMPPVPGLGENPAAYQPAPKFIAVAPPAAQTPGKSLDSPRSAPQTAPSEPRIAKHDDGAMTIPASAGADHRAIRVSRAHLLATSRLPATPTRRAIQTLPMTIAKGEMKLKPPVVDMQPSLADEGTTHTADMVVMTDPASVPENQPKREELRSPEPSPAAPSAAAGGRVLLTASLSPEGAGQFATFAELKRALKYRNLDDDKAIEQSIRAREIRVPVLRKSF